MLKQFVPLIGPILVLAIVAWRLSRASRGRPVKPNRLWIRPTVLGLFLGLAFLHPAAITPLSIAIVLVAALAGVVLGYILACHQKLTIDPVSGAITSKMSPVGMVVFLGLIAVRYGVRMMVSGGEADVPGQAPSEAILLYTDAALVFAFGLVAAQAWEIWRRAKALIVEIAPKMPESGGE